MTTKSVIKPKRKMHPNSLGNLKPPWEPGKSAHSPGGYNVSRCLKDMMDEDAGDGKPTARAIAEKMVERAKILTGKSDSAILNQLLDRTEGKVPGDGVQVNFNTIEVLIVEAPPPAIQEVKEVT